MAARTTETSQKVSGPTPAALGQAIVAECFLRHVDELTMVAVATANSLDPLFAQADPDRSRVSARRNLCLLADAIRDRRAPTSTEVETVAGVATELAAAGMSKEAVARGYSTVLRAVWGRAVDLAHGDGIDGASLHVALQTLWSWADAMSEHGVAVYSTYELEQARHDERARHQFLRRLLEGTMSATDIRTRAAAFGLQSGRRHVAVRAVLDPSVDLATVERTFRAALDGRRGLVGLHGDDIVGVLPGHPQVPESLGTVAFGPEADLTEIQLSYSVASRVLAAALRLDRRGGVGLADLGLRMAVAGEDDVGPLLEERYLAPLAASREDLAGTVDSFFRHGLHVEGVANELFLHPNSVRKRLRRFQELTGADLTDTEIIVQVWWALRRRELRPAGAD